MLALPIFTASRPATIVGADELNFCVRDGNRWTLIAINTNYLIGCTLKTEHILISMIRLFVQPSLLPSCRSSFRLISISQLNALPHLHP